MYMLKLSSDESLYLCPVVVMDIMVKKKNETN